MAQNSPHVVWLADLRREDRPFAGGKAAHLGELPALGAPVPPGFCITRAGYERFLAAACQSPTVAALTADLPRHARIDECARALSEELLAAPLPPDLETEIRRAYRQLDDNQGHQSPPCVAVRSSATDEDAAGASFAGQYETFLNVAGEEALLAAIRGCWASLWTPRAVAYRQAAREAGAGGGMAVIVQQMIRSEVSGVMFTADPVTGNRQEMIVEAAPGLGDQIVSGIVNPWRYRLNKIGNGEDSWRAAAAGGPRPPRGLGELREIGRKIEAHFGCPQDIEWAWADGKISILQARPITALKPVSSEPEAADSDARGWTDALLRERFPEPLFPLSWSVTKAWFLDGALTYALKAMGIDPPAAPPLVKAIDGRPFLNGELLTSLMARLPVAHLADGLLAGNPDAIKPTMCPRLPLFGLRLAWAAWRSYREWQALLSPYLNAISHLRRRLTAARSEQDLLAALAETERWARAIFKHHILHIALADALYGRAIALAEKLAGAKGRALGPLLFLSSRGNQTMAVNAQLAEVAATAAAAPRVAQLIVTDPPERALAALRALPEGAPFIPRFDAFLAAYGHRAPHYDPLLPGWGDEPGQALALIRAHLVAPGEGKPADGRAAQAAQAAAERELRNLMTQGWSAVAPVKWWLFRPVVAAARAFVELRENRQFYQMMIWPPFRQLVAAIGAALAERGVLDRPEDARYLTLEEIRAALANPDAPSLAGAARARRPVAPLGAGHRQGGGPSAPVGSRLSGLGASPGRAGGRACVIQDAREFGRMRRGQVLVAPSTNPAWTPLFPLAAGLITETGGMLCHAAIVAREYGIPAVLGVAGATNIICEGQSVVVDGDRGEVEIGD